MKAGKSGGILIVAVVTLAVATLLAIGSAASIRMALRLSSRLAVRAESSREALDCAVSFARDVLMCDSNGFDCAGERWCRPFPDQDAGGPMPKGHQAAAIEGEFPATSPSLCSDEDSRLPLNACPAGPLAALLSSVAALPPARARAIAGEIIALRPHARREFAMRAPSLDEDAYRKIAPFVTAAPTQAVNVNTAPPEVLEALFSTAEAYGGLAARSLAAKIADFRRHGGVFVSADEAAIAEAVGGLNLAEAEALSAMRRFFTVKSRFFSGAARCGGTRVLFTFDRDASRIVRIAF